MIKPLDIIMIGQTRAVVSKVYENGSVEVVYKNAGKHVNEDAVFLDEEWKFKYEGVGGGYADKYPRLANAIRILDR